MRLLPVIERELRASARQPFTYWLRVIGVGWLGLGIVVAWMLLKGIRGMVTSSGVDPQSLGVMLFGAMNLAMFLALALLTPLLTADCISRERREGTLGLLFLTPLRPLDIVLGKSIAQVLKGLTLYLTMLPWLTVPVLLGGVGMADFTLAALLNGGVLVLALSAGMLASARCRDAAQAILVAQALSLLLLTVFLLCHEALFRSQVLPFLGGRAGTTLLGRPVVASFDSLLRSMDESGGYLSTALSLLFFTTSSHVGLGWNSGLTNDWSRVWAALPAGGGHLWHQTATMLLLGCAVAAAAIAGIAARSVRAVWGEQPPSAALEKARRKLLTPRFLSGLLRRRLTRTLELNPIGWLHQRTPQARMVKLGWFLAVILGESIALSERSRGWDFSNLLIAHYLLALALLGGMAFSAAASFRHERENGAFELLLVTPISVFQLIRGRLVGIWMQFLPGICLLGVIQAITNIWKMAPDKGNDIEVFFLGCVVTVPVVGLWFSMQRRGLLASGLLTCFVSVILPAFAVSLALAFGLLPQNNSAEEAAQHALGFWLLLQGGLAIYAFHRLYQALARRRFALQ